MNRERLDDWCEHGILALVLVILVFTALAFGGRPQPAVGSVLDFIAINPFMIAHWLTVAVILLWLCRLWLKPAPRLLWPPICWAVVAFTLYALGRYLTADIEYIARQEFIRVLVYALLFLAILNNLHRQESTQIIALTLVFVAMTIAAWAIYQFLTDSDRVWHLHKPYQHRGTGTFISPNHLGGFLELLLPLGLAYTLVGRLKPVTKIFLAYASLVIIAGIAMTMSRGTWVACGLSLMMFFVALTFHRRHRLPAFLLLAVLVAAGAYFLPRSQFIQARLKQLATQRQAAAQGHTDLWPAAFRLWQENPWWGVGPAHFDARFRMYRPEALQVRPDRAHNDFLNTLVDWGAVGGMLVAGACLLLALGMMKTWRHVRTTPRDLGDTKRSNKFAFMLGASAGLAAILIHSTVDFNMHIPANALLAVTLMALVSGHLRFATERYWSTLASWSKVLLSVVLLVPLPFLIHQGLRRANECAWLRRAALAPNFSAARAVALTRALEVEPANADTAFAAGEVFRIQSEVGGEDSRELATRALECYDRSLKLNPWDGYSSLQYGRCLDWLDRSAESGPFFDRAERLDPNGYYTVALIGLHYVTLGNYAAAREWFTRSLRLQKEDNPIARTHLEIANRRLLEAATNEINAKLLAPPPQAGFGPNSFKNRPQPAQK